MAITGVFAPLGQGKDLLINYLLSLKDRKIITHVKLAQPHISLTIDQIFDKGINDTSFFFDSILYLSEFHLIMDARRSSASVNVDFSQAILIQLSKIDCDLLYSAQLLDQIDLRLKNMQKYFYFVEKVFRPLKEPLPKGVIVDIDRRIVRHPITNEVLPFDVKVRQVIRKGSDFKQYRAILPWEVLKLLFKNYDTREIIKFDRNRYLKR